MNAHHGSFRTGSSDRALALRQVDHAERPRTHERQQLAEHADRLVARASVALAPGTGAARRVGRRREGARRARRARARTRSPASAPAARRSCPRPRRCRTSARRRARGRTSSSRAPGRGGSRRRATACSSRASSASCAGGDELLGVDLRLQLGGAVVRVDETVDVAPEPQPEQRGSAPLPSLEECRLPWPTPTHIVTMPRRAAAPAQLVQQRDDEPRAAHPERVPDRDRAAVHVQPLRRRSRARARPRPTATRTPRSARRDRRPRSRRPCASSSLRTAGTGPIPITRGSTPATADATNVPSGSIAERARLLLGGDDDRGRAVVQARRVAGRDGAAGAERRLQRSRASRVTCRDADARRA